MRRFLVIFKLMKALFFFNNWAAFFAAFTLMFLTVQSEAGDKNPKPSKKPVAQFFQKVFKAPNVDEVAAKAPVRATPCVPPRCVPKCTPTKPCVEVVEVPVTVFKPREVIQYFDVPVYVPKEQRIAFDVPVYVPQEKKIPFDVPVYVPQENHIPFEVAVYVPEENRIPFDVDVYVPQERTIPFDVEVYQPRVVQRQVIVEEPVCPPGTYPIYDNHRVVEQPRVVHTRHRQVRQHQQQVVWDDCPPPPPVDWCPENFDRRGGGIFGGGQIFGGHGHGGHGGPIFSGGHPGNYSGPQYTNQNNYTYQSNYSVPGQPGRGAYPIGYDIGVKNYDIARDQAVNGVNSAFGIGYGIVAGN